MEQPHPQIGENFLGQAAVVFGGGLGFHGIRFLDEGVDDEGLAPFFHLAFQEPVSGIAPVGAKPAGLDLLAAWRKFVDGGDVQVAVEGQREGAGDGSGRQDQGVGVFDALLPEGGTLEDAEAVLLVHNGQGQVGDFYSRLNQGVGANQQVQVAVGGQLGQLASCFGPGAAGEQSNGNRLGVGLQISSDAVLFPDRLGEAAQQIGQSLEMLLGQHLGGDHDGGLVTGGGGGEEGDQDHHGLAAAHFALEQAVHGRGAPFQVAENFGDTAALGAGQGEGEGVDKPAQDFPVGRDGHAVDALAPAAAAGQNGRLEDQQFIEGQPAAGFVPGVRVVGVVGLHDGVADRQEAEALRGLGGENVVEAAQPFVEGLVD